MGRFEQVILVVLGTKEGLAAGSLCLGVWE